MMSESHTTHDPPRSRCRSRPSRRWCWPWGSCWWRWAWPRAWRSCSSAAIVFVARAGPLDRRNFCRAAAMHEPLVEPSLRRSP